MTIKPFAIQGSDLTLGGVNLQAGATTIVIPGVTQATNYFAEEVERLNTIGGNNPNTFGSDANAITVIDNSRYLALTGTAPSGVYVAATYSVDELDDGRIEEVDVESGGTFAAADKTRVEAANMWATTTPTPFVSFNSANWTQIPYRPKIRAGAVENVGGGGTTLPSQSGQTGKFLKTDGSELSWATASGGSGGVVERSIEFPQGEEGDTAGTLALNPMGSLFICTADWFDYSGYAGEYSGLETTGEFLPGQTGFVSNSATILRVDVPPEILYILQSAAIVPSDWSITMDDEGFGGEYTCTDVAFNVDNNPVFFWPYRNGTDPVGIPEGSTFTVSYNGTVPQPAIWEQVALGNPLGDLTIEFGEEITNSNGDVRIVADDDIRLDATDEISIRTSGTSNGNYVEVITGYDSNDQHRWKFDTTGNLTLPEGGDILDSNGDSVLGGGSSSDPRVWVQTFVTDTPTTDFPQIATSVEYDADGNVIALFSHYQPGEIGPDSRYYSVGKYTATGSKIWTVRFADDLNTDGWGLAIDAPGNWIYIAGQTGGESYTYNVATLTKIDGSDGSIEWSKVYDFGYDSSSAVVDVDSDGDPIMVGYVDVGNNSVESYLTVTKVSAFDGTVTWSRKLDGQADEQAYGMAVGPTGEVVAVGYMSQLGLTDVAATLYADPVSNVLWTGTNIGFAVAEGVYFEVSFTAGVPTFSNIQDAVGGRTLDSVFHTISGNAIGGVTGVDDLIVKVATVSTDSDDRIVVVKYDSTGTIAWQKAIQFDTGWDCNGADADIDSNGNVYICGQYEIDGNGGPPTTGMALVKFNSSGVKQWSRRVTGDCISVATSIVVGPDDKLYISGVNGNNITETFTWVVAKYSLDGLVEWQRFIENNTTWTFGGTFFNNEAGGSNIAVRQGYVALAGGFGDLAQNQQVYATVVQVPATGNVFTVGNWDFTAANLSGVLNGTASDITVVNAGLTDSNNASAIDTVTVTLDREVGNFLIGTLFTAPGSGANELVNGEHVFALESDGTLTLDGNPFNGNGFTVLADGTLQANVDGNITVATVDLTTGLPGYLTITPRSPDRNTLDTHYGFDSTGMWFTGNNEETFDDSPAYPIHTTDSFPADVKTVVEFEIDYVDGAEDWGICVYPADGVPHWSWNSHPSRIAAMIDIGDNDLQIYGFTTETFSSLNNPDPGTYTARFTYDPVAELTTFEIEDADGDVFSRCQLPGRLARDQDYRIGFDADWDNAGVGEKSYFTSLTITSGNTTDAKPTELTVTGEIKLPSTVKGFVNMAGPWSNNDDDIQFKSVAAHDGYAYMIGLAEWAENNRIRIDKYSLTSGELVWTQVLGAGRDAIFDISWTGGVYSIDNIANDGEGYQVGQLVYISGNQINGGQQPANLVTITVTDVNSSGEIVTATIAGTAPTGTSSQAGLGEYNGDGRGDPVAIKYDTVTDTLVLLTAHYTAIGDVNDNNWDRALVTRINPVSGDVVSTVTLSDEGDISPYDVAVHPTTGATAVVGEKRNEYREFGTLTMLAKGVGYFDILKSNLDAEHYPGSGTPGEYAGDYWISGTGAPNREYVDNVNYYQNLTCTTRQGSGATFEIIIDGNGAIEDYVQMLGGTNYRVGHKIRLSGTPWEGPDIIVTVAAVQNTTTGAITTITVAFDGAGTGVPGTYSALSGTNIDVGSGLTLNIEVDVVTGSRIANINLGGSNYVANDVAYISGSEFANGSDGWEILSATTSAYNGEAFFSKSTYPTLNTTLLAVTVGAIAKFENGATARVNVIRDAGDGNWGVTFTTISGTPPGVASVISFFANDVEVTIVEIGLAGGNVVSAVTAGTTPTNAIRVFVDGVDFTAVGGSWTMTQNLQGEAFVWTAAWNKAIGGGSNDQFESVVYSKDGASIYGVGNGQYEVDYRQSLVVKFATSDGTIGFSKYLNSDTENSYATGVATIGTSDIVVAGYEYNTFDGINRDQPFVARLTSSGTVVWKKFYGDGAWTGYMNSDCDIQVDSDNNIYVTMAEGADNPGFSNQGFHVTKLDQAGNLVWTRCISGSDSSYLNNGNGNRFTSLANDQLVVAGYTYVTDDDYYNGLWASFPTDGFTYFGGEDDFVQQGAFRISQGRLKNGVSTLDTGGSFTPSTQAPNITASNNLKKYATREPLDFFEQHLHKMVDPKHGGLVFGDGSRQTFATDKIPQIKVDGPYTITAQDSGKHIYYKNNWGTVLIPVWAIVDLPVGFTFTIINRSGNDCYVELAGWPGPSGTIYGAGRNLSYNSWGIPDSGSGSMVTLMLVEAGKDLGNGNYTDPVWMISGPGDIYIND